MLNQNSKINPISIQGIQEFYNQIANHFSDTRNHPWQDFNLFIKEIVEDQTKLNFQKLSNINILDLGCGNGRFLKFLHQKFWDQNYNLFGFDLSIKLIEIAQKSLPLAFFTQGTMTELPYENNYFDYIYSIAAFHHLPDVNSRIQTLQELSRVLKPEGKAIITVWNLYQSKFKHSWLNSFKTKQQNPNHDLKNLIIPWGYQKLPRFYHAFTKYELKKLIKQTNFKIKKLNYINNGKFSNFFTGKNLFIQLYK